MELDIRRFHIIARLEKTCRKTGRHCHRACTEHQIFQADLGLPNQRADLIVQGGFVAFVDQPCLQVVLHILPDTGQIVHNVDPIFGQLCRFANAGQHQDLRRVYSPATKHDFFARRDRLFVSRAVRVSDARSTLIFDHHLFHLGMRDDFQILAFLDRVQIGHSCATTPSIA